MAERRVGITGLGTLTPAGVGMQCLWDALLARRRFVRTIDRFDASRFPCGIGGQLEDFSARQFVYPSRAKHAS